MIEPVVLVGVAATDVCQLYSYLQHSTYQLWLDAFTCSILSPAPADYTIIAVYGSKLREDSFEKFIFLVGRFLICKMGRVIRTFDATHNSHKAVLSFSTTVAWWSQLVFP